MNFIHKEVRIFNRTVPFIYIIWFGMAFAAVLAEILHHSINNYFVYKNVFWHTVHQRNLYLFYPQEYEDLNHYGPVFSILIAPFALLPDTAGVILWALFSAFMLLYAIRQLPLNRKATTAILFITALEMMTSIHNVQYNALVAAFIILSFTLVEKEKDSWATLFIALGFMTKLYGIVGLAFFCFSRHKWNFVMSFIGWLVVLFALPMVISSPYFVIQSYQDWWYSLVGKVAESVNNMTPTHMQDFCVQGMIRHGFNPSWFKDIQVLLPAMLLFGLPLLRFSKSAFLSFRLRYLALALISVVIFSTSSESSTYVIAVAGVGIWFMLQQPKPGKWAIAALVFVLLVTSLSPTDLFPAYIRNHFIRPYSLKTLPCFIVWLWLVWELTFKAFTAADEIGTVASKIE
ncbi:Protein of unknown function [Filimonas lacunae]|uniref:DUF2029 domain-containing protein n=1 Tax=Filimonas lacunae TaxID=477680 RepID=A0A173MK08_9BACT|nr:glycosyltransferase family 87 protein [Filimonas lacunae]BAV07973.1 hypothetical protein FLA_4005 [Filimonas lacunae]SIT07311.1 Protein of unknown function [Filimonas lacunae]